MKLTKCKSCNGYVVDGAQKHHHLKRCVEYKEEGADYIICKVCGYRSSSLSKHIKLHEMTAEEYRGKYPGFPLVLRTIIEKQSVSKIAKGGYKSIENRAGAIYCDKCDKHYLERFARRHLETCVAANPGKYIEGVDYVKCPECECFLLRLGQHLKLKHGWTNDKLQIAGNEGLQLMATCAVDRWKTKQNFKSSQEKREQTHLERHGHKNPFASKKIQEKIKETSMRRYGVDHPMKDEEVRIRQYEAAQSAPSRLELVFDELTPDNVVYTGYGGRFVRCKVGVEKYGRVLKDLNPDFMVFPNNVLQSAMTRSQEHKRLDSKKHRTRYVIELLGDWYHSEGVIGVAAERHEREMVEAYASSGIECLVLWEHEVLENWDEVKLDVESWIANAIENINERPVWRK